MIFKVAFVQSVGDHYKHDLRNFKDRSNKKKLTSFLSVLENIMKSQSTGKQIE
ncbi:MAG: hypothetical protein H6Q68_2691 [Firmicutes bacterium]|nr:hypothetical protein [Bacillota bacterium]